MKIECHSCHKTYPIHDAKLPVGKKFTIPCPACRNRIAIDLRDVAAPSEKRGPASVGASAAYPSGEELKKRILRTLKDLPAMPHALMKAREVMADRNSGFQQLATVIETDQAIASKVLRMANSPYYGLSGKVSSIQHASVVLGYKALGDLITMAGSSNLVGHALDGYGLEAGDLWIHSLAVAVGSQMIAEKRAPELANDAFSAGLIHDAGKLILDKYVFERKEVFETAMSSGTKTFLAAENEILGFDHADMAAEVCAKWNIPETLRQAIECHHAPQQAEGNLLAFILHVADSIAMMSGIGTGIDGMLYRMDETAMEKARLQPDDLAVIIETMVERVGSMQTELG